MSHIPNSAKSGSETYQPTESFLQTACESEAWIAFQPCILEPERQRHTITNSFPSRSRLRSKARFAPSIFGYRAVFAAVQSSPSFANCSRKATMSHTSSRCASTLTARRRPSGLSASGSIPVGNINSGSSVRGS